MPILEKIEKSIPEITNDFEKGFNQIIGTLSLFWNFRVPSIQVIKSHSWDLYDGIWVNCWVIGKNGHYGIDIYALNKYRDKIHDIENRKD